MPQRPLLSSSLAALLVAGAAGVLSSAQSASAQSAPAQTASAAQPAAPSRPASAPAAQPRPARGLDGLTTRPERTQFRETSRYADVLAFLDRVDAASPRIKLTTFGYTFEGRPLPLVIVGDAKAATPEAVKATGKTRVFIQANIHAGEVEGKEAMQLLLREIANGQHAKWLDPLVLIVAPIYNADGNERVKMTERNLQNGPIGGVGTRPNAQELDLNRDHMKLESPEARSLAQLYRDYDPHVVLDLHTTNGSYHAYHLTYAPPLHPNTAAGIVDSLRGAWLPEVTKAIKAKDGWDFYYYGNLQGGGARGEGGNPNVEKGWYTFDHRPRFGTNYAGIRNRIGILSEAYSYLSFEDRIKVTRRFVMENLDYAAAHAAEIRKTVEAADAQSLVGQPLTLRAKTKRGEMIDLLMGGVNRVRHPYTGNVTLQRTDEKRVERVAEYGTFEATDTEKAPAAYLVPASLEKVIDLLRAHGARLTPVAADTAIDVETFTISGSETAARPFQGHKERTVQGSYAASKATVPAGTFVVPMNQPLARLIFTLLEPRSDDGVANWNVLDEVIEKEKTYPIRRTFAEIGK